MSAVKMATETIGKASTGVIAGTEKALSKGKIWDKVKGVTKGAVKLIGKGVSGIIGLFGNTNGLTGGVGKEKGKGASWLGKAGSLIAGIGTKALIAAITGLIVATTMIANQAKKLAKTPSDVMNTKPGSLSAKQAYIGKAKENIKTVASEKHNVKGLETAKNKTKTKDATKENNKAKENEQEL